MARRKHKDANMNGERELSKALFAKAGIPESLKAELYDCVTRGDETKVTIHLDVLIPTTEFEAMKKSIYGEGDLGGPYGERWVRL